MANISNVNLNGLAWMKAYRKQLEFRGKMNDEEVSISSISASVKVYSQGERKLSDDGLLKHSETVPAEYSAYREPAKPLPELLAYAAQFQTDRGMTDYLKRVLPELPEEDREAVEELLKLPPAEIRETIKQIGE